MTSQQTPVVDQARWRYTAAMANAIESRWQERWLRDRAFHAPGPGEEGFDPAVPKFYCLDMFPYPSGKGLHVGHPLGYTATDMISRYKRMKGFNVLHPMGWDAFGLPAEQYAISTGVHPAKTTRSAIDTYRGQLQQLGLSYDWDREFATIDPDYYKWTQWIWLQAYGAWFDPRISKAQPIATLQTALDDEVFSIGEDDTLVLAPPDDRHRRFADLDAAAQRGVIDDHRLAYLSHQTVNWCPALGTVLANEEVIDGKSERGGHPVLRQPLQQWMFRITEFAQRLLEGFEGLDWPSSTVTMQREWIGRSEGAEIDFFVPVANHALRVYTTRPDTIFGATYMVVAPEHALVDFVLESAPEGADTDAIAAYVKEAAQRGDVDRMADSKEKTGVFSGLHAVNPATGREIPIYIADYVLMGYGHGAIMAVPAHDERDYAFAGAKGLEIVQVVRSGLENEEGGCSDCEGTAVNSTGEDLTIDGLETAQAKASVITWLEARGVGRGMTNYKLRDWLFSRQRYWGEPFPIVWDDEGNHYPVSEASLPVVLPDLDDYTPPEADTPTPLLGKATDWVQTTAGEAGVDPALLDPATPVRRELNTMPGWAGSCWYYLRYCDPTNTTAIISDAAQEYWLTETGGGVGGVDLYVGGAEHAVLHLFYTRFWHQMLHDLGVLTGAPEPFQKLFHQGLLTAFAYQRADGSLVPVDEVQEASDEVFVESATGVGVTQVVAKMSKSLRNVVTPDDVISEYGADTFRLYEMYMGPLEASKPWNPRDIIGSFRFLQRAWRLGVDEETGELRSIDVADDHLERLLHRTIAKVGGDIERLAFNTAIAALIEFVNAATATTGLTRDQLERFTLILAPMAPHMAEELWSLLGHDDSLAWHRWPSFDESMLVDDTTEYPVQVMGKVRGHIRVPADCSAEEIEALAIAVPAVADHLCDLTVRKVIVVPGRIVNIVAN